MEERDGKKERVSKGEEWGGNFFSVSSYIYNCNSIMSIGAISNQLEQNCHCTTIQSIYSIASNFASIKFIKYIQSMKFNQKPNPSNLLNRSYPSHQVYPYYPIYPNKKK